MRARQYEKYEKKAKCAVNVERSARGAAFVELASLPRTPTLASGTVLRICLPSLERS